MGASSSASTPSTNPRDIEKEIAKHTTREQTILTWFEAMDDDGSGDVSLWEFVSQFKDLLQHNQLMPVFEQYDKNGDGKITKEEFVAHIKNGYAKESDQVFRRKMVKAIAIFRKNKTSPSNPKIVLKELKSICHSREDVVMLISPPSFRTQTHNDTNVKPRFPQPHKNTIAR